MNLQLYDIIPPLRPYIRVISSVEKPYGHEGAYFRILPDTFEKRIGLRLTGTKVYSTGLVSVAYEVGKNKESKATKKVSANANE